jgi:hypothetical protein
VEVNEDLKKPTTTKEIKPASSTKNSKVESAVDNYTNRVKNVEVECRKETLELSNKMKTKGVPLETKVSDALEGWLKESIAKMTGPSGHREDAWTGVWQQVLYECKLYSCRLYTVVCRLYTVVCRLYTVVCRLLLFVVIVVDANDELYIIMYATSVFITYYD